MLFSRAKSELPTPDRTLPGRPVRPFDVPDRHVVLGTPLEGAPPEGLAVAYFAMGCFWGAEELFWQLPGVWSTAVGYQGGTTPNPTYEEVCTGLTGQAESVRVVYDPAVVSYGDLLRVFWERHDPTQGFRQGNDLGTQYRSAVYWTSPEQRAEAESSRVTYQGALTTAGLGTITTELLPAPEFCYAEGYHQQYLAKNPNGYRCHATTGVHLPDRNGTR